MYKKEGVKIGLQNKSKKDSQTLYQLIMQGHQQTFQTHGSL